MREVQGQHRLVYFILFFYVTIWKALLVWHKAREQIIL